MSSKDADHRLEAIVVKEGTGQTADMSEMVDWALQVLSGGNSKAYILDVLKRAEARTPQVSA